MAGIESLLIGRVLGGRYKIEASIADRKTQRIGLKPPANTVRFLPGGREHRMTEIAAEHNRRTTPL